MVRLYKSCNEEVDYRSFPTYESYLLYLEASAIRQQAEKELDSLGGTYKKRYFQLRDKNQLNSASLKDYQDFNKLIKKIKESPEEVRIVIDTKLPDENQAPEQDRILASNDEWEVWRVVTYDKAHDLMKNSNCGWCIAGYYNGRDTDEYFNDYLKKISLDGGYYFYINKDDKDNSLCILRDTNNNIQVWACPDHRMRDADLPDNLPRVTGIDLDSYSYTGSDGYDGYYDDENGFRSLDDIIENDDSDALEEYFNDFGYDRNTVINCYNLAKDNKAKDCLDYLLRNDEEGVLVDRTYEDVWEAFFDGNEELFDMLLDALGGNEWLSDELSYRIRIDNSDSDNEKLMELLDNNIGIDEYFKSEEGDYLPHIIANFDSIDSQTIKWFKSSLGSENIDEEDSEGYLLLERLIEKGHFKLANILLTDDDYVEIDFEKYEDKHSELLEKIIDKCEEDTDAIHTLNLYNHKLKEDGKDIDEFLNDKSKEELLKLAKDGKLKSSDDTLREIILEDFHNALERGDTIDEYIRPMNKLGILNKDIIDEIRKKRGELDTYSYGLLIALERYDLIPEELDFSYLSLNDIWKLLSSGKYKFDASKNLPRATYALVRDLDKFFKLDSNGAHYKNFFDHWARMGTNLSDLINLTQLAIEYNIPLSDESITCLAKVFGAFTDYYSFEKMYNEIKDTDLFKAISKKYKEKKGKDLVPEKED